MTDELHRIEPRRRALQAQKELRETEEAFATLRQAMVDRLLGSTLDRSAEREQLYFAIQGLDAVQKALMEVIDNGLITEAVENVAKVANG